MSERPSYLKVLNAIAVGEARGQALFDAWAMATKDATLAQTLKLIAIREGEHAAAFGKRVCELGFFVRDRSAEDFEERLGTLRSDVSDAAKFETVFGYGDERDNTDERADENTGQGLDGIFADTTIDPLSGALLGRFIAEERDTLRLLQAQYERVKSPSIDDDELEQLTRRIERLTNTIEALKATRRARH